MRDLSFSGPRAAGSARQSGHSSHLSLVGAQGKHALPQPELAPAAAPGRPRLMPLARIEVEQARFFLEHLDGKTAGADLPAAMYLLGELSRHTQVLLAAVDALAPA